MVVGCSPRPVNARRGRILPRPDVSVQGENGENCEKAGTDGPRPFDAIDSAPRSRPVDNIDDADEPRTEGRRREVRPESGRPGRARSPRRSRRTTRRRADGTTRNRASLSEGSGRRLPSSCHPQTGRRPGKTFPAPRPIDKPCCFAAVGGAGGVLGRATPTSVGGSRLRRSG